MQSLITLPLDIINCLYRSDNQFLNNLFSFLDVTSQVDPAKYFYDVASKIHNDWKKLVNKLDHNINTYEIEANYSCVYDRAYNALDKWKQSNHATVDRLVQVLHLIRRLDIADAITNSNDE